MGEMNNYTNLYMRRNAIFADFMNLALFQGKRVIQPENLHELSTDMIAVLESKRAQKSQTYSFTRDILKEFIGYTDGERIFAFLGIENQTDVHYALPVWHKLYDALQLYGQVEELTASLRDDVGLVGDRIKRGFKGMKLHPVFTAAMYWGTKPWDGPHSMHDMFYPLPDSLRALIPDERVIIIEPRTLEQARVDGMDTNLRLVFECMRHKDAGDLDAFVKNTSQFKHIDKLAGHIIRKTTGAPLELAEDDTEGEFDMQDTWKKLTELWFNEGKQSVEPELILLKAQKEEADARAEAAEAEKEASQRYVRQNLRLLGMNDEQIESMFMPPTAG